MNELRNLIQSKFNEIQNVECIDSISDDIIEIGKTYFSYELQEDNIGSDMDNNYTMKISITGKIMRKNDSKENTLEIIDLALAEIKTKLKDLNFKYSYKDITLENGIRKILVTGEAKYNEINNKK